LHVQVGKRRVPVDIFQQNLEHLTLIAEPFFLAVPNDCYQICVRLALCAQELTVSLVQEELGPHVPVLLVGVEDIGDVG
jgi:hypothetical protein